VAHLPRQIRLPHQEAVDRLRAEAAFADGPNRQRLASAHVACREHLRQRGLVVGHVGADIASRVELDAELLQQPLMQGMHEAHGERHELGFDLGSGPRLELAVAP
jgi:hypothetical protein